MGSGKKTSKNGSESDDDADARIVPNPKVTGTRRRMTKAAVKKRKERKHHEGVLIRECKELDALANNIRLIEQQVMNLQHHLNMLAAVVARARRRNGIGRRFG